MCSIIGYLGSSISAQDLRAGFDKTISRGPDDTRMLHIGAATLGFHRLAIMGLHPEGMQPFTRDGSALVCNGEIYGFRPIRERLIAEGETFESESDCEILLPLYEREGLDIVLLLDAEFAMILYDAQKDSLIAARDPIGIRPLFYGYLEDGGIVFASEAKNLVGLVHDVMPFPPGHYYADGKFTCYRDMTHVDAVCEDDLETVCTHIREKLIAGVEKRLDADAPLGFLLSGGLDSSLMCAISAKLLKKPIRTFAIGMRADAIDLKYAREVAEYLHADHTEVIITPEDVIQALPEVVALLGTYDITTIRASIGMYLVCKAIHEQTDLRVLLTGEISDELFGYKYTDFAPSPAAFQEESAKRIRELHMYDVYTPIVADADQTIPYEQAKETVLEALQVLGEDYVDLLKEGFNNRWIDVYENVGKRSGAYSSGNSRPHPYVLLNHKDNLDCQFTLAHEMGHALHSYHSCKYQPVSTSDYVIFVAEVASTCNEVLLMRHLLKKTTDKKQRAYLINHFMDQFKGTVYRQTMFAEFELAMGKMAENGQALTADALCQKYHELNKLYFGPDMVSDDQIALEWARIPHFFYNYYVFQYATGFSAAVAIANRILKEGAPAVADYKKFLSGGCSTDPISLLKIAGVDMSSPEPVNSALALFGELVDEMEQLV